MKIFVILLTLSLSAGVFADQCDDWRNDAYIVNKEMGNTTDVLDAIKNEIYRIETVLMSDTLDAIGLDALYTKYIDAHVVQRQLEAEYRSLEDRSFMIEIWRIRKCGLPVTYRPKKRNKKT